MYVCLPLCPLSPTPTNLPSYHHHHHHHHHHHNQTLKEREATKGDDEFEGGGEGAQSRATGGNSVLGSADREGGGSGGEGQQGLRKSSLSMSHLEPPFRRVDSVSVQSRESVREKAESGLDDGGSPRGVAP